MLVYYDHPPLNKDNYVLAYFVDFPWYCTLYNVDTKEMESTTQPKATHNLTTLNRTQYWSCPSGQVYYMIKSRDHEKYPICVHIYISRQYIGNQVIALMALPQYREVIPTVACGWLKITNHDTEMDYEHRFERIQGTIPSQYNEQEGFCIGFTTPSGTRARIDIIKLCRGPTKRGHIIYQKHGIDIYMENRVRRNQRVICRERMKLICPRRETEDTRREIEGPRRESEG